jgi:hypothetical protein
MRHQTTDTLLSLAHVILSEAKPALSTVEGNLTLDDNLMAFGSVRRKGALPSTIGG